LTKESTPLSALKANLQSQLDAAKARRRDAAQSTEWAEHADARALKYQEAIEALEKAGLE
jgi:hypothetical protein